MIRKIINLIINNALIINEICDSGLSTIRVLTLNKNDFGEGCIILACVFMMINGSIVNCEVTAGLTACINIDTGIVETDAVDVKRNFYVHHPISGITIKGFKIPYWKEVLELINKIYDKAPKIKYIG